MSDLDLGMNMWMSEPFAYPEQPIDRGKVLDAAAIARIGEWGRYKDVDGDGIPYRSLPGTDAPPYFARGSGHNARGQYSERADDYVQNMERLKRKFDTAKGLVPQPEIDRVESARVGFIAYGTSHWALLESRDQLRDEAGLPTSYLRLRGYPFPDSVAEFIAAHDRVYVIEQNRDAQMLSLLRMDYPAEVTARLRSVLHFNGLPIDARSITDSVLAQEGASVGGEAVTVT
jgi:2-oxoglutarate ferredoxin oxidoreductase subunit alpha